MCIDDHRKSVAKDDWVVAMRRIDMAIWDIIGKSTTQPSYKLLGGYMDGVPVHAASGFYFEGKSIEDLVKELQGFVEIGYRAVKMKVGAWMFGIPMETDIRCIKAVGRR